MNGTRTQSEAACPCPVCGFGRQTPAGMYNGYSLFRCPRCTFVYTSQREFDRDVYDNAYRQLPAYQEMLDTAERTATGEIGFHSLSWFKRFALKYLERKVGVGSLLDVGCGPGTFLIVAWNRGWVTAGIEPASPAAGRAASFGLRVFCGRIECCPIELGQASDAVTCFEVLEHVPDPLGLLRLLRMRLCGRGTIVLSVPNLDDPFCLRQKISSAMPPIHVNFFNRRSLRQLLERAGFRDVRFRTLPIPTSSVRNVHGRNGFLLRLPVLALLRVLGKVDGTTLVAVARR